ncbi:MAG: hypothetical protein E7122_04585 [Bacteroidales bacterium]|nr:hypothetical protein [Bacteroidales bacterium]
MIDSANYITLAPITDKSKALLYSLREGDLLRFKEKTGARIVSGYTKSVDCVLSAINDIAYFSQLLEHPERPTTALNRMSRYYEGLGEELGFRVI